MLNPNKKIIIGVALVLLATGERLWFDIGSNVELVTLTAFIASLYIGKKWGILLPLVVLGITDLSIGNTSIAWFTWSAYLGIGLGSIIIRKIAPTPGKRVVVTSCAGIVAALWFFLWTNYGVWLLDSWGMYSNDWEGLVASYINGLPFLRNQLIGNLVLIPAGVTIVESVIAILPTFSQNANSSYVTHTS